MKYSIRNFAMAALLAVGVAGCASDESPRYSETYPTEPGRPVMQSPSQTIEGQVIRNDGDAFVICGKTFLNKMGNEY